MSGSELGSQAIVMVAASTRSAEAQSTIQIPSTRIHFAMPPGQGQGLCRGTFAGESAQDDATEGSSTYGSESDISGLILLR